MDKYDEEIEQIRQELETNEYTIKDHWNDATPLFNFASNLDRQINHCGCLTHIACGYMEAQTEELTQAIRNDPRIPGDSEYITLDDLPVFAEWQRRLDKELNRA